MYCCCRLYCCDPHWHDLFFVLLFMLLLLLLLLFGLFVLIPVVSFYVQISFHRYFCNWWKLFMLSLWHCMIYNLDFLLTCCIVGFLCMINIINDKDLFLEKKRIPVIVKYTCTCLHNVDSYTFHWYVLNSTCLVCHKIID